MLMLTVMSDQNQHNIVTAIVFVNMYFQCSHRNSLSLYFLTRVNITLLL